ncbi:MAG: amidohydrolase family protein [Flavobacteriaceae bacterium]
MTSKTLRKTIGYSLMVFLIFLIISGLSYYIITIIQKKNNLMDIGEYSPKSTLVVNENKVYKSKFPFIDVHSHHWDMPIQDLSKLVSEMDSLNMAYLINLSGSGLATFFGKQDLMEKNLTSSIKNVKENFPKRFGVFFNINFNRIDDEDFKGNTTLLINDAVKQGAIGLKVYKNLGLNLRDSKGKRVPVDDERLSFIWEECAKLNIPVLIHSGEPKAFFDPIDKFNERWLHAREKPNSFRSSDQYPPFEKVMLEQYNMFRKHPKTMFINAHFGWYANDLNKLSKILDELKNVNVEFGAVINELGRQPRAAKNFFIKYQDRILFGKDIYKKDEYYIYFRVLETSDEYIQYYRKRHGLWRLYGMGLPDVVLKKIYHENALKMFPSIDRSLFN